MSGRVSAETRQAIELHKQGKTISEACSIAGIARSTLYIALERDKAKSRKTKSPAGKPAKKTPVAPAGSRG